MGIFHLGTCIYTITHVHFEHLREIILLLIHMSFDTKPGDPAKICQLSWFFSKLYNTHKNLYPNVDSSIIHNSQKVETTQMSIPDKWIKTIWYMQTVKCYSAGQRREVFVGATTWMSLESITLRSHSQKTVRYMIPFIWNVQSREIYRQKGDEWLPRAGGGGVEEDSFWGDENVLKLTVVVVAHSCEHFKSHWIVYFIQVVTCMLRKAV